MKVLLVDNYDSFTFNLFHYLDKLDVRVEVHRSDALTSELISNFDKIILSPGPGLPSDFPGMIELIQQFYDKKPILGVCLGMQAICEYFNSEIYNLIEVYHGVQSQIKVDVNDKIYQGLPENINVARYHSWAVRNVESNWFVTGITNDNVVMSVKHKMYDLYGIQYHPESILTSDGIKILSNFLSI